MQVLPSMPKGDIIGKYWTSNECVLMIVVINGNSGDGRIRRIKATGGTALKKEDRDPVIVGSHPNFPKGRQPSYL
jgi:hypothetical protein